MKREDKDWIESSGNVFEDMGFEKHEAEILKAKAQVMTELEKFIKAKNLTQAQAAEILGVDGDLAASIKKKLKKLLPYRIGKYGQLQEWRLDFEDSQKEHGV